MCPFDNTADAESLKAGPVNQFTTPAGWLVLLQLTRPTYVRPKSLSNQTYFGLFSRCFFKCFVGIGAFSLHFIRSILFSCEHNMDLTYVCKPGRHDKVMNRIKYCMVFLSSPLRDWLENWCLHFSWFCIPPPLFWGWILLILRLPKGGYCSISDDLSCSWG